MSSIFVSYRSTDLASVQGLYDSLVDAFGADHVVLAQSTFVPGTDWLQQIRAGVAAADTIVLAIGPSWSGMLGNAGGNANQDYIVEELTLARSLGKPILPVLMHVTAKEIAPNVPREIQWVNALHFLQWQPTEQAKSALLSSIANLSGIKPRTIDRHTAFNVSDATGTLRPAISRTLGSMLKPVGHAAASLRPTVFNVGVSAIQVLIALSLLALSGVLLHGGLTAYSFGKIIVAVLTIATMAFIGHALSRLWAKAHISPLAAAAFALHFAAVIATSNALWILVFWACMPASVFEGFASISGSQLPPSQAYEATVSSFTSGIQALLVAIQVFGFIHLSYVVFGNARAAAISLGSRRWIPSLILAIVVIQTFGVLYWLFMDTEGVRKDNLPLTLNLTWSDDKVSTEGLTKGDFLFELSGKVDKQQDLFVFDIQHFNAENRHQPTLHVVGIMCGLRLLKGGKFEWANPMLLGRVAINRDLESNARLEFNDLQLNIPLSKSAVSGETEMACYVERPDGSYPVGDGGRDILRW